MICVHSFSMSLVTCGCDVCRFIEGKHFRNLHNTYLTFKYVDIKHGAEEHIVQWAGEAV